MIQLTRRLKYVLSVPLFIISIVTLSFASVQIASATTLTWTGDGDGTTFADGDNWSTDAAPVDGDVIQFGTLAGGAEYASLTLNNNLSGVSLGGITALKSSSGNDRSYYINTATLQDDAVISYSGSGAKSGSILFGTPSNASTGTINAEGDLTITNISLGGIYHVTGNLTTSGIGKTYLSAGSTVGGNLSTYGGSVTNSTITGSITLQSGGVGLLIGGSTRTVSGNITINSLKSGYTTALAFGNCAAASSGYIPTGLGNVTTSCSPATATTITLSGNVTLNADAKIDVADKATAKFTGTVTKNGHSISQVSSSAGTLIVNGATSEIPSKTTNLDGSKPSTSVSVANKETATLSGTRGAVGVLAGGTLKGTGTAQSISVSDGGTIAPGNSPGKITSLESFVLGGQYKAEILNKDSYDQVVAGEDFSGVGSAVTIQSGATLKVSLYNGWSIKNGDTFTIINNKDDAATNGKFSGLDEGEQFDVTSEGKTITFSITYEGGSDDNDVIITALTTGSDPTPPNTGAMQLTLANPIIAAVLGLITATLFIGLAVRRRALVK